jgi:pimeloyl-ACP methyl ester carboxylesterase
VSGRTPPPAIVEHYARAEADTPEWLAFRRELEELHGANAVPLVRCWVQAMRRLAGAGGEISLADARRVECPALVIAGDGDPFNPIDSVKELAGALPGAGLLVFPGAGHDLLGERRAQLLVVVRRFLEQHTARSG